MDDTQQRLRKKRIAQGAASLNAKLPPHSIEAEQSTLGAMLIEAAAIDKARGILNHSDFYREAHQIIFLAVEQLAEKGSPVDFVTLSEELKATENLEKCGGIAYLVSLFDTVPSAANVTVYAKIVEEKAIRRRVITAALEVLGAAHAEETSAAEVVESAETSMFNLDIKTQTSGYQPFLIGLTEVYNQAEAAAANGGFQTLAGVPTGIPMLDLLTGGLKRKELTVIAARPSMGKTALALDIALKVAKDTNRPVLMFSLEMSHAAIALRALSSLSQVDSRAIQNGQIAADEWSLVADCSRALWDLPFAVDASEDITPSTMRASLRRFITEHGDCGLVVVDYLQLIESDKKFNNRVQEVDYLTRSLKKMTTKFDVPIVVLSQLSRSLESRVDKRPQLSDLRESGGIEQDADNVIFIYREEYYKRKELHADAKDNGGTIEKTELILAKQRNGPTGTIPWGFIPRFAKFVAPGPPAGFTPQYSAGDNAARDKSSTAARGGQRVAAAVDNSFDGDTDQY